VRSTLIILLIALVILGAFVPTQISPGKALPNPQTQPTLYFNSPKPVWQPSRLSPMQHVEAASLTRHLPMPVNNSPPSSNPSVSQTSPSTSPKGPANFRTGIGLDTTNRYFYSLASQNLFPYNDLLCPLRCPSILPIF